MHPKAVAQLSALRRGQPADPVQLLFDLLGPLAPGQIGVGVSGRDLAGLRRGATEEDGWQRIGSSRQGGLLDAQVLTGRGHRGIGGPQPADDVEELAASRVAVLLLQEVAERPLLGALAAGDHVEHQPALRLPLEGGRHLRGQRRADQPRAERHQVLQRLGAADQHRGTQPGVFAPQPGRRQHRLEPVDLGGLGELDEVFEVGRPVAAHGAAMPTGDQIARVAVRRKKPMQMN